MSKGVNAAIWKLAFPSCSTPQDRIGSVGAAGVEKHALGGILLLLP
jgi:hypothetical protein